MEERIQLGMLYNMCLVNNLAMVHLALNNTAKSRECLNYVLGEVVYLVERGGKDSADELEGFIGNTVSLILSGVPSAPAA